MTTTVHSVPEHARERLHQLGAVLRRRLPAATLAGRAAYTGTFEQRPVLVTIRLGDDPAVVACHRIEQSLYRAAADGTCPLPLGVLRYADELLTIADQNTTHTGVTGRGRIPGEQAVRALLDQLDWLYAWQAPTVPVPEPSGPAAEPVGGQVTRTPLPLDEEISGYVHAGLIGLGGRFAIREFLAAPNQRIELGNVDPRRFRFDRFGPAGIRGPFDVTWRTAGYDWALMALRWGPGHPWLHRHLADRADRANLAGSYAAQWMLFACRTWTTATAGVDASQRQHLKDQVALAREHLRVVYEATR